MAKLAGKLAGKRLGDVEPDKRFWCCDGQTLQNLHELKTALVVMSEETYRCHASATKNDFSTWVRNVIGDDKLSRDLAKSVTREHAARSVASRIDWLQGRAL